MARVKIEDTVDHLSSDIRHARASGASNIRKQKG